MASISCEKCEEWGIGFRFLVILACTLWILIGSMLIFKSGVLTVAGFIGLFLMSIFALLLIACRHCYYYGKRCYATLGLIVPFFFKKSDEPPPKIPWDGVIILTTMLYPLIFIFKLYSFPISLLFSLSYLISPIALIILVFKFACPRCKHKLCPYYPDKKNIASIGKN
jgi:hypothetical protein